MSENNQNIDLKTLYAILPEPLKDIIFAPETSEKYDQLAIRFQLNEKQRDTLSAQTTFLLMGLRNPQELVTALATELGIEKEKASLIAQDLNRDLFAQVKDDLKSLYAPQAPATATPLASAPAQSAQTPTPSPAVPVATSTTEEAMPKPHIGNIFEEKLGGAFRVKSDTVQYSTPATTAPQSTSTPQSSTAAPPPAAIPKPSDPYRELPI
jgi:hypothetical protein